MNAQLKDHPAKDHPVGDHAELLERLGNRSIVFVGHYLPLSFPRLAVSPAACATRCSVRAGW